MSEKAPINHTADRPDQSQGRDKPTTLEETVEREVICVGMFRSVAWKYLHRAAAVAQEPRDLDRQQVSSTFARRHRPQFVLLN